MKIAVYCGSDFGNNEEYTKAARELGQWIGKSKYTLIYGGGESGLMGAVAKEVHAEGSEVIGVIPGNVEYDNKYEREKAKNAGSRRCVYRFAGRYRNAR